MTDELARYKKFYKDVARIAFNERGDFKHNGQWEDRCQAIMGKVAKFKGKLN